MGYYNYEAGHKYALSTVNTEFRNKLSNTELNIYELEASRLIKHKKALKFNMVNGIKKLKKTK